MRFFKVSVVSLASFWLLQSPLLVQNALAVTKSAKTNFTTPGAQTSPVQINRFPLNVVNPSSSTNKKGALFPGFRGANQLILYDNAYSQSNTGTNEYGFEVTVINGRVVEQEGSDSRIPSQNGFVLSGHGVARTWLLAHAPLGAHITLDLAHRTVTSRVDYDTYRYRTLRRLDIDQELLSYPDRQKTNEALDRMDQLNQSGEPEKAIELAQETMSRLNQITWQLADVYSPTAIRGIWHRPVEQNPEAIEVTIERLQKAGLNTIFLETFYHGYPIFPSKAYLQEGIADNQYPAFKGWDPLDAWVRIAHKHGMQLHAWFQSFYVGTNRVDGQGPILKKHPDWANVQFSAISKVGPQPSTLERGAYFADPANPQARLFLLTLLQEMVDHYAVDGVQLDYMDYPMSVAPDRLNFLQTTWGYSPVARQAFIAQTGVDPIVLSPTDAPLWLKWNHFKEQQVNEYMAQAAQIIHQKHPKVQISATAFAKLLESKVKKHEDWALWAEKGWIDFLTPMLLTSSVKVVESDTEFVRATSRNKVPIVSGIFSPFNGSGAETLMDQVVAAHQGGASGFSIFDTAHLDARHRVALRTAFAKDPLKQAEVTTNPSVSPTSTSVK